MTCHRLVLECACSLSMPKTTTFSFTTHVVLEAVASGYFARSETYLQSSIQMRTIFGKKVGGRSGCENMMMPAKPIPASAISVWWRHDYLSSHALRIILAQAPTSTKSS